MDPIVLASASPRRRALLEQFGFPFHVIPPRGVEPIPETGESAIDFTRRSALVKGRSVARLHPAGLVLAADTVVVLDGDIIGKPSNSAEAGHILERLSGTVHEVISCLALLAAGQPAITAHARTNVVFRPLSPQERSWYVQTGDGLDKAGAYGIQSLGGALIQEIHGDWCNVVGLPIPLLIDLLITHFPSYWPPAPANNS